jgi:two-component system phosphate regulon response regulator PhoB
MPKKILVVEDNLDTRQLLHYYFKAEGFDVVTAADGREGLYMATAERPDLIVTDINMPELHGIELIRQLRALSEFKNIPIIALTAYGLDERDEAIRAGANRAADKPTDLDSLVDDIEELLKEKE